MGLTTPWLAVRMSLNQQGYAACWQYHAVPLGPQNHIKYPKKRRSASWHYLCWFIFPPHVGLCILKSIIQSPLLGLPDSARGTGGEGRMRGDQEGGENAFLGAEGFFFLLQVSLWVEIMWISQPESLGMREEEKAKHFLWKLQFLLWRNTLFSAS